jgi:hypothetical protein
MKQEEVMQIEINDELWRQFCAAVKECDGPSDGCEWAQEDAECEGLSVEETRARAIYYVLRGDPGGRERRLMDVLIARALKDQAASTSSSS